MSFYEISQYVAVGLFAAVITVGAYMKGQRDILKDMQSKEEVTKEQTR